MNEVLTKKLTNKQIKHYDDFGYVLIRDVVDKGLCRLMKSRAKEVASTDHRVYLNIHRDLSLFENIVKDEIIVGMVKQVQRSKVMVTNDQYLYKKPGTPYAKQAWSPHQDATYVNAPYGTYMQLFIFLDENCKENGGLYYYPGSHKESMLIS